MSLSRAKKYIYASSELDYILLDWALILFTIQPECPRFKYSCWGKEKKELIHLQDMILFKENKNFHSPGSGVVEKKELIHETQFSYKI